MVGAYLYSFDIHGFLFYNEHMKKLIFASSLLILLGASALFFVSLKKTESQIAALVSNRLPSPTASSSSKPLPRAQQAEQPASMAEAVSSLSVQKILANDYHVFQTFNNCAPAALSMALSYYGVQRSQEELADDLRPVHNLKGINDDKSTPPDELAEKSKEYGLVPYYRANGSVDLLKRFIANGLPVVVRTRLDTEHDFAHYRVLKGYDDTTGQFVQDDGFQGKNIRYSYAAFMALWKPFNYEYLVMVPVAKKEMVEKILGEETDPMVAWRNAARTAEQELEKNPGDVNARFNLAVSLYYSGESERSAREFEEVERKLTTHVLWYRIEPIQNYFLLKNYDRVFVLSDSILNNKNPAFSELYLLKGKSYLAQGDTARAREEFKKAVLYNKNFKAAREALASVESN